jgi:hypothetical protein
MMSAQMRLANATTAPAWRISGICLHHGLNEAHLPECRDQE